MTQQQSAVANLKEQIKVRGLADRGSFKDTPLTRFKAGLSSWDPYIQPATQPGWSDATMVKLQFDEGDLDVIESDTPYSHPSAAIEIKYSDSSIRTDGQGNAWAFFVESCLPVIPEGQGIDALVHHMLELEWRNTFLNKEGVLQNIMVWGGTANPKAVQRSVWILVGFDGKELIGGGSAPTTVSTLDGERLPDLDTQMALAIDGKDKNDANQALMGMEEVRTTRTSEILNGSIYTMLIEAGKVTVDESEVYHKV